MADFCKECSITVLGRDYGDLAGISTPDDTAAQKFATGICEGCAASLFDHQGICSDIWCETHGAKTRERLGFVLSSDGRKAIPIPKDTSPETH